MEVLFASAATRAEVAAIYPGATVGAAPDAFGRRATPAQRDELIRVIGQVFPTAEERAQALTVALADSDCP